MTLKQHHITLLVGHESKPTPVKVYLIQEWMISENHYQFYAYGKFWSIIL